MKRVNSICCRTVLLSVVSLFIFFVLNIQLTAGQGEPSPADIFVTADNCQACHNNLQNGDDDDLSIGMSWRGTIMAHSAKDPYWLAGVRRETIDHPKASAAIEDKCATCHMPMQRFINKERGEQARVLVGSEAGGHDEDGPLGALAQDGVSCSICHQIQSDKLGKPMSFTGGFVVDTHNAAGQREAFGPYLVAKGTRRIMRSATGYNPKKAVHIQRSEFCATCHTLYTHTLDHRGNEVGEMPEQVPYLEWRHSDYAQTTSCQDCHMETVAEKTAISSVLGPPRTHFSKHAFRGGNRFMLKLIQLNGRQLGTPGLSQDLSLSVRNTEDYLMSRAAKICLETDESVMADHPLIIKALVKNLAGHKLPTAYPSRRVWIHLKIKDSAGKSVFESGAPLNDGSIEHNDNDENAASYEPHYTTIDNAEQVQIYESIMKTPQGRVTTGLLSAIGYHKDNRLLPNGFDKTSADPDIAVRGEALHDETFAAGHDEVVYTVTTEGRKAPFTIVARLLYQPIGFRWAKNIDDYDSAESRRFIEMFNGISKRETIVLLSETSITIQPGEKIESIESIDAESISESAAAPQ